MTAASPRGDARPVGIFDSGIGGLSVWRELDRLLPAESCVYVADQAHVPYGPRPAAEILRLAEAVTAWLLAQDCKLIVVACNSASAAALQHLRRAHPDTPFVVLEPAVKPAAAQSRRRIAGALATPATLSGELYRGTVARHGHDLKIVADGCPGLVDAIESCLDAPALQRLLDGFVAPARAAGADVMVLACTHYPLIKAQIATACGPGMTVIDPAPAVARQVARLLAQHGLQAHDGQRGWRRFLTTAAEADTMQRAARHWLGEALVVESFSEPLLSG